MRSLRAEERGDCTVLLLANWWSFSTIRQVGSGTQILSRAEGAARPPPSVTQINTLIRKYPWVNIQRSGVAPFRWAKSLFDAQLVYQLPGKEILIAKENEQVDMPGVREVYVAGITQVKKFLKPGGSRLGYKGRKALAALSKTESCIAMRLAAHLKGQDLMALRSFPTTLIQKVFHAYSMLIRRKMKTWSQNRSDLLYAAAFLEDFEHILDETSTLAFRSTLDQWSEVDFGSLMGTNQWTTEELSALKTIPVEYYPHSIARFKSEIQPVDFCKVLPVLHAWVSQIKETWTDPVKNVDSSGHPLITNIDLERQPQQVYIFDDTLLVAVTMLQAALKNVASMLSQQGESLDRQSVDEVDHTRAIVRDYEDMIPLYSNRSTWNNGEGMMPQLGYRMFDRYESERILTLPTITIIKMCDNAVLQLERLRAQYLKTGYMKTKHVCAILDKLKKESTAMVQVQWKAYNRIVTAYYGRKAAFEIRQRKNRCVQPFLEKAPPEPYIFDIWDLNPRLLRVKPVFIETQKVSDA